jgi:uncharacterized protein YndB with AHSA1/START domain
METETQPSKTERIQKKILLRAPRSRVWRAIAHPDEFGSWFGVNIDGPVTPGARVKGKIVPTKVDPEIARAQSEYEGMPFEITVERIEPERLFSFRWHPFAVDRDVDYSAEPPTLVSFEIDDAPGGVMLTVTESGFDRIPVARRAKAFAANEQGWAAQMKLIEKYLAQSLH